MRSRARDALAQPVEPAVSRLTLAYLGFGVTFLAVTEMVLASHDSTALRIVLRLLFIVSSSTLLAFWIARELRRRRRIEASLEHAQRFEALGRLAGGVAHDFNNLLTVINGYSELVMRKLPDGDASRQDLAAVQRAGEQARALVDQLLTLSRRRVTQPVVVDPNDVVRSLGSVLDRVVGRTVELVCETPPVATVVIDPSQLEQVLLNLAVNARDAMPAGGELRIATADDALPDGRRAVAIAVRDTGAGMDPEIARRCFDPFFTTKPKGEGTGLGLATVYAVVTQAGGDVEVATVPGRGTTFTVRLPAADEALVEGPTATSGQDGASETVLIVEDEAPVADFGARVLAEAGYVVRVAASGQHALDLIAREGPPDVLVTDVVMPGMGGIELARRVTEAHPDLAILYVSGFADEDAPELGGDARFLAKPFGPGQLLRAVGDALRAAQGTKR